QPGGQEGRELEPAVRQHQQRQQQADCADAADQTQATHGGGVQAGLEQHGEQPDRQDVVDQNGQLADPDQRVGRDDGSQDLMIPAQRPGAQAQIAENPAGQYQIGR